MSVPRWEVGFAIAAALCFLIATTGFDIAARVAVGGDSPGAAVSQSLYYSGMQPIGMLLLFGPFAVGAWISLWVKRKANTALACLLFAASMTTLGYFYFVGHWDAEHALQQKKWTASALSVGLLPFVGAMVVLASALVGGAMILGHRGTMRLNSVFKGRRAKRARP
jgi:hypothetical protein